MALVVNVALPGPSEDATTLSQAAAPSTPENRYEAGTEGLGAATTAVPANMAAAPGEITTLQAADDLTQLKGEVDQLLNQARAVGEDSMVTEAAAACLDQLGDRQVLISASGKLGEREVIVHIVQEGEQPQAHVYDASTCEELDLDAAEG